MKPPPLPFVPPRKESRWRWHNLWPVGLVLLALLPVLLVLKWRFDLRRELQRELEICRRAGQPVTLKELAALHPPVADDENAWLLLLDVWRDDNREFWDAWTSGRALPQPKAFREDPSLPILGAEANRFRAGQPLTAGQRAVAAAWWKSNDVRMTRVASALQRPRMHFPLNFEDGFAIPLPHLAALKGEALRFRLRSLLSAEAGDAEAAVSAIEAASATAKLLETEPLLVSQLVGLANRNATIMAVEDFLNRLRPADANLARLIRALAWAPAGTQHRLALNAERALSRSFYALPPGEFARMMNKQSSSDAEGEPIDERGFSIGMRAMRFAGLAGSDELLLLRTVRKAGAAAEPVLANRESSRAAFAAAAAESKALGLPIRIISAMLLPGLEKTWDNFARSHAETEMMRLALALERHQLEHGTLPPSLDALIPAHLPAVAEDPFSGRPLRYRRLDHGYLLYSVGPDGVDDGGRPRDAKDKQQKTWDIPFTVERPDLARPGAPSFRRGGGTAPVAEE